MATYLHLAPKDIKAALRKLMYSLKTNSFGIISFRLKQGDDNLEPGLVNSEKQGKKITRYFAFYQAEEIERILLEIGFNVIHKEIELEPNNRTKSIYFYLRNGV